MVRHATIDRLIAGVDAEVRARDISDGRV